MHAFEVLPAVAAVLLGQVAACRAHKTPAPAAVAPARKEGR